MQLFILGVLGSITIELIRFYELSNKLTEARFRKLLKSTKVWAALFALFVASGTFAFILYADEEAPKQLHVFISGAAARSILRDLIAARLSRRPPTLGGRGPGDEGGDSGMGDYFS